MPQIPSNPNWSFDVITAHHDDMKGGGDYTKQHSRVVVSRQEYPDWRVAAGVAACMALIRHGGMAIDILPRF